jgi:hypothetical protein
MAATGLEAAVVFLLGVDGLLEGESDPRLDDNARAELAAENTRLLYMSCTRAARRLVIFSKLMDPGIPDVRMMNPTDQVADSCTVDVCMRRHDTPVVR